MVLSLVIFGLLITAAVFSIIELALSAYVLALTDSNSWYWTDAADANFVYILFASIWTLLVTAFLLVWPFLSRSQLAAGKDNAEKWLAPLTLTINTITMILWLAAFSSLANLYRYAAFGHGTGAAEAFGVLLWLVFLALTVLNFLTAFGVYKVDRAGHSRIFSGARVDAVRPTTSETPQTPQTTKTTQEV